jgi:two-component system response regulator ResD
MASKVLVVDDEPIVREVLGRYLAKDGFDVELAGDGEGAVTAFVSVQPDLVLLDLMLPKLDGFEVFERIKALSDTPVIMLTAKTAEHDRIAGLEMGANDYVSKPFSPAEVVARVKAVLRRMPLAPDDASGEIRFGAIEIDVSGRQVVVAGTEVSLTPKEFDLLYFLASNPGHVFTRLELLEELWDFAFFGDPATVTVHMRRLREKIESDPSQPHHLVTVWGTGYRFDP